MKRGALAALLAAATLLLAGCSMDVDAYLIPPKLQGEEQQIQQALDEFIQTRYGKGASTNYTLKYPKGGEYTSAFILTDLNSGRLDTASKQSAANDVALAFYQVAQKGAAANTHINLLRQTDGDWTSVSDVEGLSTDIERVVFGDLDGDGIEELMAGWSIYNNRDQQLHVYSLAGDTITPLSTDNVYTQLFVGDVTSSGRDDLLLMRLEDNNVTTARLKGLQDGQLVEKGAVRLDGYINQFGTVQMGRLADGIQGVYIDALKDANTTITELVYWDHGRLNAPFYDTSKNITSATARSSGMAARDIDADGRVEIPLCNRLPGYYETADPKETMWLTGWYDWDYAAQTAKLKFNTVLNLADGYYVRIDDSWKERFTTLYTEADRTLWFKPMENGQIGEPFMAVRIYKDNESVSEDPDKKFEPFGSSGHGSGMGYTESVQYAFWFDQDNAYGLTSREAVQVIVTRLLFQ